MNKNCPLIVAITGVIVLCIGATCVWYGFPRLIDFQIYKSIEIKEGSPAFNTWKKQPFPLTFKVYFFNVSNPQEVQNGEKPVLKEVGPYIYDLYYERTVEAIDDEADTIKYYMKKNYFFNASATGCRSEDDMITVINVALMGTVTQVTAILPTALPMVQKAIPYMYPGVADMFLRVRVKDLLFDGVRLYCSAPEIDTMCTVMRAALPETIKVAENDKDFDFSILGSNNGTSFGPFIMERGMKNTTRGILQSYKDKPEVDNWGGGGCNKINGSDSGLNFPMKEPVDKIYTFFPEVCRSFSADFEKSMVHRDIKVFKYSGTIEALSHAGANRCFCADEDGCPPDGIQELTPCLQAPVLLSYPHFYLADTKLLEYAVGINPKKELHESFLLIEPSTATPIEGAKRIQLSIELKRYKNFPLLQNISEGIFPILWMEEGIVLSNDYVTILRNGFRIITILDVIKWQLVAMGFGLIINSLMLVMYKKRLLCFTVFKSKVSDSVATNATNVISLVELYPGLNGQNFSDNVDGRNSLNNSQIS